MRLLEKVVGWGLALALWSLSLLIAAMAFVTWVEIARYLGG